MLRMRETVREKDLKRERVREREREGGGGRERERVNRAKHRNMRIRF